MPPSNPVKRYPRLGISHSKGAQHTLFTVSSLSTITKYCFTFFGFIKFLYGGPGGIRTPVQNTFLFASYNNNFTLYIKLFRMSILTFGNFFIVLKFLQLCPCHHRIHLSMESMKLEIQQLHHTVFLVGKKYFPYMEHL